MIINKFIVMLIELFYGKIGVYFFFLNIFKKYFEKLINENGVFIYDINI